jgi:LmbE family N-acetylglucosaminyl deacetylase
MTEQLHPMPDDWQRALAIVAHPDDLEFGISGAIASWTDAGREVAYVIVSSGEAGIAGMAPHKADPIRRREQRHSAELVGVREVEFLGYPDGVIQETTLLRRDLARAIRRHRPDVVLTLNHHDYWEHGGWNTADHRAVGRAVLDAVADAGNEWIFPLLTEEGYAPWNGVRRVAVGASPKATHAVDISATFSRAVDSLTAHRTYLAGLSDQDPAEFAKSFLSKAADRAAQRFGGRPAVAFELIDR